MYLDLIEHFPAVLLLLGLFFSATVYLIRHFFVRMEQKVDDLCKNTVTKSACDQRHADLRNFVSAILGMTDCKRCKEK